MSFGPFLGDHPEIEDYFTELALGNVQGATAGFLVGINRNLTTTEENFVADQGGHNLDLSGNTQLYISSDSALDTDVDVVISNVDEDYNEDVITATTNGHSQVATSSATHFKTQVMIVSGQPSPVGNLYLAEADTLTGGVPDTAAKIRAIIPLAQTEAGVITGTGTLFASDNISHLGTVTVPADKQLILYTIIVGSNKNDNVKIQGRVRFFGGPWLNRNPIPIYQSNDPVDFKVPLVLPPKADLQFMASSGSNGASAQVLALYELRDV